MSDTPRKLPSKKDVALSLLEVSSVYVHLDPRRPGVSVPKNFLKQPQLILQMGLNMVIPIPDLVVDDEGISCTLSFSRVPFWCRMPWPAIYALVAEDGRGGMIWPDDVPPELSVPGERADDPRARARKPRPKPALHAVSTEEAAPSAPADNVRSLRPAPQPQPAAQPEPARAPEPQAAESASPRPAAPGKKAKRELPPYLRVVK